MVGLFISEVIAIFLKDGCAFIEVSGVSFNIWVKVNVGLSIAVLVCIVI